MAHVVNALVAPGVAVAASQPARGSKNYCNAGRPAIVAGLSSQSSISAPTSAVDAPVVNNAKEECHEQHEEACTKEGTLAGRSHKVFN